MYTFKELDYFFKNLFKEKRESNKQNLENLFEKLRNKTRQKQPAEVFYEKSVLRYFSKFTGKYLCQSLFFNKVAGLRPFLQNTSGRLLLTRDVMGPQAKLRKFLEDAKQAVDEAVQISVNELFLYILSK